MFGNVIDKLFGCSHKNYSFPITAKKGSAPHCDAGRVTGTYVVCLECGKEFPYDWSRMKVVSVPGRRPVSKPIPQHANGSTSYVKAA